MIKRTLSYGPSHAHMCGHPKREEDEQAHHLHEGQPGGPEALGTAACRKHPERPECCEAHPCGERDTHPKASPAIDVVTSSLSA